MGGEKEFKRIPRRIVPLRKDESIQLFVESERLGLAEDSALLCKGEIANAVNAELVKVAQPGYLWKKGKDTEGLPDSWDLFSPVRLLAGGVDNNIKDSKIKELQRLIFS